MHICDYCGDRFDVGEDQYCSLICAELAEAEASDVSYEVRDDEEVRTDLAIDYHRERDL